MFFKEAFGRCLEFLTGQKEHMLKPQLNLLVLHSLLLVWTIVSVSAAAFEKPPADPKCCGGRDHITPVLVSPFWMPVKSRIRLENTFFLAYEVLRGQAPSISGEAEKHHIVHPQTAGSQYQ